MKSLVLGILHFYRHGISPFLGENCRFSPSCSAYAEEAVSKKGIFAGARLAIQRLLKCHPFHPGGYDPCD